MKHADSDSLCDRVILHLVFLIFEVFHFSHVVDTSLFGQKLIISEVSSRTSNSINLKASLNLLVVKMLCFRDVSNNVVVVTKKVINFQLLIEIIDHPSVLDALHEQF